jgi:hypothetical protein
LFDNFVPIFGLFLNDNPFLLRFRHFITNQMIDTFLVITCDLSDTSLNYY